MDQLKPQKSQFWIWTTLWLTTLLDSVIILVIFSFLIIFLASFLPSYALGILIVLGRVLALWLGACIAVKYVLKRSIVLKNDATKLATLTIVVPLVIWIILISVASKKLDTKDILEGLLGVVLSLGFIFYSVRRLISTRED